MIYRIFVEKKDNVQARKEAADIAKRFWASPARGLPPHLSATTWRA